MNQLHMTLWKYYDLETTHDMLLNNWDIAGTFKDFDKLCKIITTVCNQYDLKQNLINQINNINDN